jgi:hypothetical protein
MRKFVLNAFLCAGLVGSAFSATHNVPRDEPIATIRIPEKWQTKEYEERVEATSPDRAVSFLVMPPEANKIAESMGEVMRYIRNRGGITVKAETLKREQGKLNGMEVRNVSWLGKDTKGDIKIRFTIVSIPGNKILLVAYWASPEAEKKHQAELTKMLQSIKKA